MPTVVLMENAGRNAAAWLRDRLQSGDRVLIACGPGNNGGDGGVVARHLDAWGFAVRVLWFAATEHIKGDAAIQHEILEKSGIKQDHVGIDTLPNVNWDADWVVDALLGTGLTRPVEGLLASAIEAMNRGGAPILALDLPSGLDADTGQPLGSTVRAKATVTFVAPKLGFRSETAQPYLGEVFVAEIGVSRCLLEEFADK
jgi:NAD(P)H-hydrate epimerase